MSHTTHTNEEFSQVLTALLQERKKVQDLEEQLLTLQESRESEEGGEAKSMFLMLKKKYAQALHALNDKEKRLHDLEKIQTQYDALKNSHTQIAKKAEIAEEESQSLRQQHHTLVAHLREAQENAARIQIELDQTEERLQGSDHMRDMLEKENQELKSLRDEYEFLKVQAEASQLKADELAEKLSGSHEQGATIESLREERDKLAEALTENLKRAEQLDQVVIFLRERNQEAQAEINQLKEAQTSNSDEITSLRQELKSSREEAAVDKEQKQTAENELKNLQVQCDSLKAQAVAIQAQLDAALLKQQESEQWKLKHDQALKEKEQIGKELQELKNALEEREARIKIAQQHLAKKVKETNLLLDRVEEQKVKNGELQGHLDTARHKIAEMQHTLDLQVQQEKRIEENLLDSLKTAEVQARRWEEKYFLMSEKWQQAEAYNRDLKGLEEKFNQVQAVFASLGNIINMNSSPKIEVPKLSLRHGVEEDAF